MFVNMRNERKPYWERERECEQLFEQGRPYFFITTPGLDWMMYRSREEYIVGTNLLAVSSGKTGFKILDDVQMTNHHHVMGQGSRQTAEAFVTEFHAKQRRFQSDIGNPSLKEWPVQIEETTTLQQFRNRVAYTDRNPYVAQFGSMPTGYPWSSGHLFFNGVLWTMKEGIPFEKLSIEKRRNICRSHDIAVPEGFRVLDGMILRSSFVDYRQTERLFNSANQYFSMLTRHGEADVEIARILGEHIQLPNDEVFQIVGGWFPGTRLDSLGIETRLNAAKMMKTRLSSSNKQIVQVLRLPKEEVDAMFPSPK